MSDFDLALDVYQRIASGGPDEAMCFAVLPGAPPSKKRHRSTRAGRTYQDPVDLASERRTALLLKIAIPASLRPFDGNVALGCAFFRPNRQRIDTDNMLKHVCDSANGLLWRDDSQITSLLGITELDRENPRTIVVIAKHHSTLKRDTDDVQVGACGACGSTIITHGRAKPKKYCSVPCQTVGRGGSPLTSEIECPQCRQFFRRKTSEQRLCSPECRGKWFTDRRREARAPRSECDVCGVQLSHTRGGKCRPCWASAPKLERAR